MSPMSKLKNSNEGSRHSLDGGRFSIAGCSRRGEGRGWQPGRGGAGLGATALWTRLGKNVGFVANSFKRHAFSGFQVYIDSAVMNHQALIEFVKSKAVVFKVDLFPNVSTKDKKSLVRYIRQPILSITFYENLIIFSIFSSKAWRILRRSGGRN